MRQYKLATALVLFAAFAYADDGEEVDDGEDGEDGEEEEEEEETLIDFQQLYDDGKVDMGVEDYGELDQDLYDQYIAYVEAAVGVIDAAVDAQALTEEELEDLGEFLEDGMTDEQSQAIEDAAQGAADAVDTFVETLEDEDGDYATAVGELETMFIPLFPDGEMGAQGTSMAALFGDGDFMTEFGTIFATITDETGNMVEPDADGVETIFESIDNILDLTVFQDEVDNTVTQVDAAYAAVSSAADTMIDDIEAAWEEVLTAFDETLDDENHETVQKLFDIISDSIDGLEADDTFQESITTIDGYVDELTTFVDNETFTGTIEGFQAKVKGVYDFATDEIAEGMPERTYPWEEEEVPDNAFSFAASAAAVLASAAVLAF